MTLSANWYRDGTATSANGSQNIVGAGTLWSVQARKGDLFAFLSNGGISKIYEIDTVTDNTHIVLKDEFYETGVTNGDYVIIRNFNTVMTSETNAMLVSFLREWKLALQNNFKGDTGDTGEDGNTIYSQSGVPSVALGKDGDFCIVTSTWNLYKRVAGAWVLQGGLKGENGTNGYTVHRNNGVPSSSLGANGDWCINYAAWNMYYKSGGAWVNQGTIKGADGADGNTVLSSNGIPDSGIGVNDDWCLDYANWSMYRKESGSWVLRGSVKGETGAAGSAGAKWYSAASDPSSAIGITGDYALNTASGDVFKRGAGGWSLDGNIKGATGATGAQGPQGATGETGATGTAGSRWHVVSGIPSTSLGAETDMALDTVTSNVYRKESGAWVQKGNIKGATGDTGAQGIPGVEWKGEWNSATEYVARDAVYYNGNSYLALQTGTNQTPPATSDSYWQIVARKGTDGEGAGDMLKIDYDSNADGKVNAADAADMATYAISAGRATVADSADAVAWEDVSSKPTDFAPSAHALDAHTAVTLAELNAKISDKDIASTDAATTSAAGLILVPTNLYARSDKFSRASANTLSTPAINAELDGDLLSFAAGTIGLNTEASWDASTYATPATRSGKDFYVYATADGLILSANATYPTGYTAANSRKIGGFHCLCVAVGTISGHPLSGMAAGDILPASVWDLQHRPICSPEGMVYSEQAGIWVDIYLQSGTGASTKSVNGGTITDNRDWMDFVDDLGAVGKRLLDDGEFQKIAAGGNEETNIAGSADPGTTTGHTDTAGRRMVSNIGCEDCAGVVYQWLLDQSYRVGTGAALNWYDLPGAKGSLYNYSTDGTADVKLVAGGNWAAGVDCGSRCRHAYRYRWVVASSIGARGCCGAM